jgi:hypothetical protein
MAEARYEVKPTSNAVPSGDAHSTDIHAPQGQPQPYYSDIAMTNLFTPFAQKMSEVLVVYC